MRPLQAGSLQIPRERLEDEARRRDDVGLLQLVEKIAERLESLAKRMVRVQSREATEEELRRVHSKEHVARVRIFEDPYPGRIL